MSQVILFLDGPNAGRYLRSYDPDFGAGRGQVVTTDDLSLAQRFPNKIAAWQEWRRPSKVRPLRPDGKPNRPMTAFSVTVTDGGPE